MPLRIIHHVISREEMADLAGEYGAERIKGVVDVSREAIALGGHGHVEGEALLLQDGSRETDLWGFTLLLGKPADQCLAFHSSLNIRPRQGNPGVEIDSRELRERMRGIILRMVPPATIIILGSHD